MKKKYPALKKHICRFNDGDCICECFDKGYKKAKADIIKQKEEIIEDLVSEFQMEGDYGKLTPFQQTVNTYIKNRGEEIINLIKEI